MDYSLDLLVLAASIGLLLVAALIARPLERIRPIQLDLEGTEILTDYKLAVVNVTLSWLFGPLAQFCGAALINAAGGGFIPLRMAGWWVIPSTLVFVFAYDLYRYWAHRLSHMIRPLWALHSLHHSAEAMTIVTGARHHWLEGLVHTAFFPVVPIIFQVPLPMLTIIQVIYAIPCTMSHINYRFSLGRFVTWVNSPQWHRIHHSTQPEHFDKNFCTLLPLMDIIFGTAWVPGRDEFAARTGLVPSARPNLMGGVFWPLRHYLNRWMRSPRLAS